MSKSGERIITGLKEALEMAKSDIGIPITETNAPCTWPSCGHTAHSECIERLTRQADRETKRRQSMTETAFKWKSRAEAAEARVAKLEARLQIDHVFVVDEATGELVRRDVPPDERDGIPDLIDCLEASLKFAEEPPTIAEAAKVLRAWADENIIVDTCIPKENREPGCLSCDTLAFFEALECELAERANA